ncbi:MAG: endonuclease/exonuclease/phosphatase family protein [Akkermansiaceae bacterium]|nr:endonuclease/exonuclease/phosphatase family protein [Akkermansiaceae bacterium]
MRRKLSRTHWAARLLGVSVPKGHNPSPGLIMIQIDGLSRPQFEKALANKNLPHIARTLRRRQFHLHSFYSGVPSTTPAVQGELFYGVRAAVPAFQFLHRASGDVFRMYDAKSSEVIEDMLREKGGPALLEGGHTYSNIYQAGCAGSWYCSQDLSPAVMWRKARPLKWLLLSMVYLMKILRVLSLAVIEFFLAFIDCVRGLFERQNLLRELLFIPARVGICIMLREFIRFRVLLDIERGVRVIHANFLGYDEQAHRRGPDSAFAHWTLKGIDDAIRDIQRAAIRSDYRDFELIIYSDHGQERTTPYETENGRPLGEALGGVFREGPLAGFAVVDAGGAQKVLGTTNRRKKLRSTGRPQPVHGKEIIVAAMGPVGHIYLPTGLPADELRRYAGALVEKARIPCVLIPAEDGGNQATAITPSGVLELPQQADRLLGGDHPFLEEAGKDLVALCAHPDAGDLIISGWRPGSPISFPPENGAHGGPGSQETHGFLLLPEHFEHEPAVNPAHGPIRGGNLYQLGREFLDGKRAVAKPVRPVRSGKTILRVMTYNIHSCVGIDGKLRPERVARVINRFHPDIIALQEVDAHRLRSAEHDQADLIARHLEFRHVFHSMLEEEKEKYGIAVFSPLPFEPVKTGLLTKAEPSRLREARGAIWVKLGREETGRDVHFINTHFGLGRDERNRQAAALMGDGWLGSIPDDEPVILCGDFNSTRRSVAWKRISERYQDAQLSLPQHRPRPTFPSMRPLARLDHVFISRHFKVRSITIPHGHTAVVASDHLPLCVELEMEVPQ